MGRVCTRDSGSALHGFAGTALSVAYESRAPWKCGLPPGMSVCHHVCLGQGGRGNTGCMMLHCLSVVKADNGDIIQDSKMGM